MSIPNPQAERAGKLVEALRGQREQGSGYPLTAAALRNLADPHATDDELLAALAKKPYASQIVLAAKKDPASPLALVEDAPALAASPLLLEYALGKLATAERPLHLPEKVASQVDKALRPAFIAAVQEKLAWGTLPDTIGQQEAKGKVFLYLKRFPPPPPPQPKKSSAVALAEQLLAELNVRHHRGESAAPLAELVGPDVKPALLKKALTEEPFRSQAVVVPVSKTLALASLSAGLEALLGSDRLLLALLEARTTAKKPWITLAQLADGLPEDQYETFLSVQGNRIEAGSLPPTIFIRMEGDEPTLCLKAHVPEVVILTEKLLSGLRRRRESGEYPVSLQALLHTEAPEASPDLVAKLSADKGFKTRVMQALAGDPSSPVVLAGDEERLAASPALVEFAVGLLSTADKPLHPLNKIAGKLDKAIRPVFTSAVERQLQNHSLPASVVVHDVKGEPHLPLARHPLPRDPVEVLAEKLLAGLREARDSGTYPLPLNELVTTVDSHAGEKQVKAALGRDPSAVVIAVPGLMSSLVALADDQDRLAAHPRLLEATLAAQRTSDNQVVPAADLGKKLAAELKPAFTLSVEHRLREGSLPPSIGCLVIRKKPHLFLIADLTHQPMVAGEPGTIVPGSPATVHGLPATVHGLPATVETTKPLIDFASAFANAFDKLDREPRSAWPGEPGLAAPRDPRAARGVRRGPERTPPGRSVHPQRRRGPARRHTRRAGSRHP